MSSSHCLPAYHSIGFPFLSTHGGGGVSDDFGLASAWAHQRTLRLADGPDEVHARAIARMELGKHGGRGKEGMSSGDMGATR